MAEQSIFPRRYDVVSTDDPGFAATDCWGEFPRPVASPMKTPLVLLMWGALCVFRLEAQFPMNGKTEAFVSFNDVFPSDWRSELLFLDLTEPERFPRFSVYELRNVLSVSRFAAVLKSGLDIRFEEGEVIDSSAVEYRSVEGAYELELLAFRWVPPGIPPTYVFPLYDRFPGRRDVIAGVKYREPDTGDLTFGWFRYHRDQTGPTDLYALVDWNYNPFPNQPIRAGWPPDLPAPVVTWTEGGLQVTWPEAARILKPEMTSSLTPPVQWAPVETGGSTEVSVPFPDEATGRVFFRLVAPIR
jgi:hypothetical protein